MKELVLAAAIALAGVCFLLGGRYAPFPTSDTTTKSDGFILVLDRLTGVVWRCGIGVGCIPSPRRSAASWCHKTRMTSPRAYFWSASERSGRDPALGDEVPALNASCKVIDCAKNRRRE